MPDEIRPICGKCGKPKTAQRTGTVSYWLCVPCYKASAPLEPEYRAVETFPRPPSNEQTLLTELGEVKRQMKNQGEWIIRMRDALSEMAKERDALAVTADRQAEQIRRLRESLDFWQYFYHFHGKGLATEQLNRTLALLKETAP